MLAWHVDNNTSMQPPSGAKWLITAGPMPPCHHQPALAIETLTGWQQHGVLGIAA
jgi:hypothetical protein